MAAAGVTPPVGVTAPAVPAGTAMAMPTAAVTPMPMATPMLAAAAPAGGIPAGVSTGMATGMPMCTAVPLGVSNLGAPVGMPVGTAVPVGAPGPGAPVGMPLGTAVPMGASSPGSPVRVQVGTAIPMGVSSPGSPVGMPMVMTAGLPAGAAVAMPVPVAAVANAGVPVAPLGGMPVAVASPSHTQVVPSGQTHGVGAGAVLAGGGAVVAVGAAGGMMAGGAAIEKPPGWQYLSSPAAMGFREAGDDHLSRLVGSGKLEMINPRGESFGDGSIKFTIRNTLEEAVSASVPMGSMFQALESAVQNLIAVADTVLDLAPGEVREVVLGGYCGNSNFACPGSSGNGNMSCLGLIAPAEHCSSQGAVWEWTDRFAPPDPEDLPDGFTAARDETELLSREFPEEAELLSSWPGPSPDRFDNLPQEDAAEDPELSAAKGTPPPEAPQDGGPVRATAAPAPGNTGDVGDTGDVEDIGDADESSGDADSGLDDD